MKDVLHKIYAVIQDSGKGSLYNTFGSKHELYKQVLERYHEIGIREQKKLLHTPIPVKERLSNFLNGH